MKDKNTNYIFYYIIGVAFLLIIVVLILIKIEIGKINMNRNLYSEDGNFSIQFIQKSHQILASSNYMISPYSVEIALSMMREGADGDTLSKIKEAVPERKIKNIGIPGKVDIANGLFIKKSRKNNIKTNFQDTLISKYQSEIIYDNFHTPKKINDWISKKTNKMIPTILEQIDSKFVLGLANAVAMEEEWESAFNCVDTHKEPFYMSSEKQKDVSMMFHSFNEDASYYSDGMSEAIVLPYKKYNYSGEETTKDGEQLEFIGILPKNIDTYIDLFSLDVVSKIDKEKRKSSNDLTIQISIPKYEFDFNFVRFKDTLMGMGLSCMFLPDANFKKISDTNLYISDAIHKTYVKVDEKGTKASAVTFFGTKDNSVPEKKDSVSIVFDKPFIFMIKDTVSNEILFFGVVYEPNDWKETTC